MRSLRRRIERHYGWNAGTSGWQLTNESRFVYDGNVILQHRNANNLPALTLTRGTDLSGSLQGAGGIGGLLAMTENSLLLTPSSLPLAHSYYHADGNGNVTCLINTNQAIVAKAEYDPFGNFLSLSGAKAGVNCYWFSSKPIHWQSGKYDFRFRWYSPQLDRWLNADPIEENGGINLYSFVQNKPIDAVDNYGLLVLVAPPPAIVIEIPPLASAVIVGYVAAYAIDVASDLIWPEPDKGPLPLPAPKPKPGPPGPPTDGKCPGRCKECDPVKGTKAIQHTDLTGPPHGGIPTPHSHILQVNQSPYPECQCFWNRAKPYTVPGIPKYDPITKFTDPPGGGGPDN